MTSKERVVRTLKFDHPDKIPVQSWMLPEVIIKYGKTVEDTIQKYAADFFTPDYRDFVMTDKWTNVGTFIDGWGCVWKNHIEGIVGEVKHHPLDDYKKLEQYKSPKNLLRQGWENVDNSIKKNIEMFVLTPWSVNLFERMQFLRGTENLLMDLALESEGIYQLRDIVFDYYFEWLKLWLEHDIDGVVFSDDWGTQNSLLVSPEIFRKIFKPCYIELINICKEKGKYVFFHSDGNIFNLLDDFIDMGVDAINCQTWIMDINKISQKYRGRVTFWGELDRQNALPFGTTEDIKNDVQKMKSLFINNGGGLIGVSGAGADCSLENIIQSLKCWNQ